VLGDGHDSQFWHGHQGTLPLWFVVGAVTGSDTPIVPAGVEALAPVLTQCRARLGHS
jgi:hypothetical protein